MEHTYEEIAEVLCFLANGENEKGDEETINKVADSLSYLKRVVDNPYEDDSFRTIWNILDKIANYDYMDEED